MSIEEPTAVGTVVRLNDDTEALLVKPGAPSPWWRLGIFVWCHWDEIKLLDPVVIHEGYTPPTPEPIYQGARVLDADGNKIVRFTGRDDEVNPWISAYGTCRPWCEITQPVTVISDGSDW